MPTDEVEKRYGYAALNIVRYCAEEVARQMDGPLEVLSMCEAWHFAQERQNHGQLLSVALIASIGTLVHPWKNRDGFRRHDISVGPDQISAAPYELQVKLGRLIKAIKGEDAFEYSLPLIWRKDIKVKTSFETVMRLQDNDDSYDRMPAVMAYYNFERIHPFADGNGRTGKIILNWLNGTLAAPVMPPNFFSCSNP